MTHSDPGPPVQSHDEDLPGLDDPAIPGWREFREAKRKYLDRLRRSGAASEDRDEAAAEAPGSILAAAR
jgi:hypothetical protein